MAHFSERTQRPGGVRATTISELQRSVRERGFIVSSTHITPEETGRGVALHLTQDILSRMGGGSQGYYGTAAADYTSGSTISLTPCDCNGVATGESAVTVSIPTAWGTVDLSAGTVGGSAVTGLSCKIASGTLLQYAYAANGTPYLLGLPPTQVLWDYRYDTTTHKFQVKLAYLFGTNVSTVSAWLDARACTQVTAITAWQVDGTSGEIQKKTQAFYAPEVGSESAWTKIDDTTESDPTPCS